jgi:rubrerythrin
MSEIDLSEVATHADLVACLDRLYIRADSPSYRDLQQRTAKRSGSELPSTGLKRVRLGRSAIGELLRGSAFPKKAFLLTFVEACGVDVAADLRWAQAWDRLSEQYAKRAGQAQTDLAQLRTEVARLHAEVAAGQLAVKKAQAEGADLRTQLAAAQNAERARLEALHQLERTQQQLAHTQAAVRRLRKGVKELEEKLQAQTETGAPAPQPDPSLPCPWCGALVVPGAAFCPKCERNMGYPRAGEPYARTNT